MLGVFAVLAWGALELHMRLTNAEPLDLWQLTGRDAGANPMKSWAYVDAFSAYRGRPGGVGAGKTINSLGFMSTPEMTVSKPPDTVRIAFLGGSSTAGMGNLLADEETWPWIVANELRPAMPEGRELEFLNAALSGYSMLESYGRLWVRLRAFEPDVVVVYHGWNDMYYFDRTEPERFYEWRTLPDGEWTLDRTRGNLKMMEPWALDHVLQYSQVAVALRMRLQWMLHGEQGEIGGEAKPLADDFGHEGLDVYRYNLQLMQRACELMGAELFVAKQATLIVPDLDPELRKLCRYDYHGFDHDAHVAAYQGLYDVIDEVVPADHVIDVTSLSGRPEVFADHVHPTEAGARRIAALVADALQDTVTTK